MEVITKEIWKTVIVNGEVYENYMVSNLGNVKSLKFGKEKILRAWENKDNYLHVDLYKNGKRKTYRIHRLVAEAFIPKIKGKNFVDHIDGNRLNNVYTNLRYCTQKENCNFELARKHYSEAKKGKQISEETKNKIGKSNKGKIRSEETKKRLSEAIKNNEVLSKKVLCIETGTIFPSVKEASRQLKVAHQSISACCRKERNSAGKLNGEKLHWKYVD